MTKEKSVFTAIFKISAFSDSWTQSSLLMAERRSIKGYKIGVSLVYREAL